MSNVRIGIVGCGGMGLHHARYLAAGEVPGAELAAVCDVSSEGLKHAKEALGENSKCFDKPECWKCEIPVSDQPGGHQSVTRQWVDAIVSGKEPLVDGREGIKSVELSNAMLLSTWTDGWVDLPIDEDLFYEKLQERIAGG